jgi:hypothetical protein
MLDQLVSTVNQVEPLLVERGFSIETVRSKDPSAPDTGYVDFFSRDHAARITMFRDGLCDMEIVRGEDGTNLLSQHTHFTSPEDVQPAVIGFLKRLLTETGEPSP